MQHRPDGEAERREQKLAESQAIKLQPRLAWIDFLLHHPGAHLVSAVVLPSRTASHLRRLHNMMNQLIEQQNLASPFSTAIVREENILRIQCGFADKRDADVLARLTNARRADLPHGWSSHRSFRLSAGKEVALAGLLTLRRFREPR